MYDVIIRTKKQMESINPMIYEALTNLTKNKNVEVPLIYEYLHNPNIQVVVDSDNRIGTVKNIRKDNKGNIVATVLVNFTQSLSSNFTGVIDNMLVSYNSKTNKPVLDTFIIYDKEAKKEITNSKVKLPKPGEIPIMSNTDLSLKEISETLLKEYENMIGKQDINLEKEENINE